MSGYRDGYDLIMGAVVTENNLEIFKPFGYSTTCKISDSTETGERATKEPGKGKFKEKYVKSLSEQITAEGFVYDGVAASSIGFPDLKTIWINAQTVKLRYKYRDQSDPNGQYEGDFIITSLEQDGPADDDEKWSVTFENNGAVTAVSNGGAGGVG